MHIAHTRTQSKPLSIRRIIGKFALLGCVLLASNLVFSPMAYALTTDDPLSAQRNLRQEANPKGWYARWVLESGTLTERQRHTVYLEVLNDEAIRQVLNIGQVSAKGLFIEQPSNFWNYGRSKINGVSKESASLKLELYPAKAGEFTLPSVDITLGRGENAFVVRSDPLNIVVESLPKAAQGKIVSPQVTAQQQVTDVDITEGGAVTRTVTLNVQDLPGHYISELPFIEQIEGVEIRTGNSTTSTDAYRADLTGTRSTNIHYRFTNRGQYELPAMHFEWWDTDSRTPKMAKVDAISVNVMPAPPLPWDQRIEVAIESSKESLIKYRRSIVIAVLVLIALARFKPYFVKVAQRIWCQLRTLLLLPQVSLIKLVLVARFASVSQVEKAIYLWLRNQGIYDINHYPDAAKAIQRQQNGEVDVDRHALVTLLIRQLKQMSLVNYHLQPLNKSADSSFRKDS